MRRWTIFVDIKNDYDLVSQVQKGDGVRSEDKCVQQLLGRKCRVTATKIANRIPDGRHINTNVYLTSPGPL